jgi:hypothetical protein
MQPGLKYGLLAAAGMSVWMLGEFLLGLHTIRPGIGHYTSWGTEIILVAALWRMLYQLLYQPRRHWLPVWEGLRHGTLAGLIAAMGFYVFLSCYLSFLNPEYADSMLQWQVDHLRARAMPEPEIREMARAFRWSLSPAGLPVTVFGLYLLIAVIAAPLLTLWLNWRRKEEPVHVH